MCLKALLSNTNATTAEEVTRGHCFNMEGFLSPSLAACSSLLSLVLLLSGCISPATNQVACEWKKTLHLIASLFLGSWGLCVMSCCSEQLP